MLGLAAFVITFLAILAGPTAAGPMVEWSEASFENTLQLDIRSAVTGLDYRVLVKASGEPAPQSGYPALWMMDGFATFPRVHEEWSGEGRMPAGVIVAVGFPSGEEFDSERRSEAYTPVPDADPGGPRSGPVFGGADGFRRFLVDELRPVIESRFPLDSARHTLLGFSYGGLFTLDTVLKEPDSFQRYWAASPSVWFSQAQILRRLRGEAEPGVELGPHFPPITITAGQEEQFPTREMTPERLAHLQRRAMIDNTREIALGLEALGYPVDLVQMDGQDHYGMLDHAAAHILDAAFETE